MHEVRTFAPFKGFFFVFVVVVVFSSLEIYAQLRLGKWDPGVVTCRCKIVGTAARARSKYPVK